MKTELVTKPNQEITTPQAMIQMAISSGADLEKLEKLLTLQERWEVNEARKLYHAAMAQFKANPPKIDKDRTVAYGNTKYNHASLGNVTEKISAELSKYGLSASWTTKQNGAVSVTCHITHEKGHGEETTLTAKEDSSGSKNAIQALGSTITYLERYTLLALTGLATYEQDDDGIAAGKPLVSMPTATYPEKTQPSAGQVAKQAPGEAVDTPENAEGPISAEQGMALLKMAAKNGWNKKDVTEYIHGLGYENIKTLTNWDLPTVTKRFSEDRLVYEKRVKNEK